MADRNAGLVRVVEGRLVSRLHGPYCAHLCAHGSCIEMSARPLRRVSRPAAR